MAGIVSAGLWNEWVCSVGDLLDGPRILELGYGPGHLQAQLSQSSEKIYGFGLDSSIQMSKITSRRLDQLRTTKRLVVGKAQNLPFPTSLFNQVVATFPSEYIFLPETLREIKRILIPDGKVFILFQAYFTGTGLAQRAANFIFKITGQSKELNPQNRDFILKFFIDAGFDAHFEQIEFDRSLLFIIIAQICVI